MTGSAAQLDHSNPQSDCDNDPDTPVEQCDIDGDGRGDACDNCVDVPNPGQFDGDGDGDGYLVAVVLAGGEGTLGDDSVGNERPNTPPCP